MNILGNEKADEAAKEAAKSLGRADANYTVQSQCTQIIAHCDHQKESGNRMDKDVAKRKRKRVPSNMSKAAQKSIILSLPVQRWQLVPDYDCSLNQ
jgi:ribosomal protein S20